MKYLEVAPFAVTSDGAIFLNAAVATNATNVETVIRAAVKEKRAVFIGVMLNSEETEFAMARLDDAATRPRHALWVGVGAGG